MSKDYYDILGVDKGSSSDEIKKAFRKKAQKYHPDKPDGDEVKFKEANEAYTVLSDDKKRQQYDTFGSAGAQAGFGGGQAGGFGGGGFDFNGFQGGFQQGGQEFDFGDIFGDIFGAGGRGGPSRNRGSDISVDLDITFKESVFGVEKEISLYKNKTCESCEGNGSKDGKNLETCGTCSGNGRTVHTQQTIMGNIQTERMCAECNGTGQRAKIKCSDCDGLGINRGKETVSVNIPPGLESHQRLRVPGRGEDIPQGQSGDLYINIFVTENNNFEKRGNDVYTEIDISITDAVLGAEKEIKTVDGSVKIKIPSGTSHGTVMKVKNEGFSLGGSKRGSMMVKVKIDIPKKVSKKVKGLYEEIKEEE